MKKGFRQFKTRWRKEHRKEEKHLGIYLHVFGMPCGANPKKRAYTYQRGGKPW